jgi:hypothetical protein
MKFLICLRLKKFEETLNRMETSGNIFQRLQIPYIRPEIFLNHLLPFISEAFQN